MFYPNPFDFNGDGDLDFAERAFHDELMSGGFDADEDEEDEEDDDYEEDYDPDGFDDWDD